jgi:hypothetical protein
MSATNTAIPAPVSQTLPAVTIVTGPTEPQKTTEILNLSAWLAAFTAVVAASTTYAAFQSNVASLPQTP